MLLLKLLAVTMGAFSSAHKEEGPTQPHHSPASFARLLLSGLTASIRCLLLLLLLSASLLDNNLSSALSGF